jgi:arylsulfatase A-like enzyme
MNKLRLALLLVATSASVRAGAAERPNILFIFADDHATAAVSAYGSKLLDTPNLDRIAREGMRFDRCYATNSICAPSRAVVLTGLHSHRNGVMTNREPFDGSQTTFPKLLQNAGYHTALIGKWHLKSDPTGFDHWQILIDQGPYYNPRLKTAGGEARHEGYTTDVLTDLALDWLTKQRDAGKPFLLMLQHKAPHREWQPPARHAHRFDDRTIPEPPTLFDDYSTRASGARSQEMSIAEHLTRLDLKLEPPNGLTPAQLAAWRTDYAARQAEAPTRNIAGREGTRWRYQCYMRDYLGTILAVDESVGRVLRMLDESGLAANTLVVYSSDQGFFLGEHGWYDKRWFYEESARMPLLVRWPERVKAGSTSDRLVQNLDFAPTFLEIAGVSSPSSMQGRSLVPLLRGAPPSDWRESIYYHYYEFPATHSVPRHLGMRTDRYKLIHYYQADEWELFDLSKDLAELRNVAHDPAYRDERSKLARELTRLRQHYGDAGDPTASQPASPPR